MVSVATSNSIGRYTPNAATGGSNSTGYRSKPDGHQHGARLGVCSEAGPFLGSYVLLNGGKLNERSEWLMTIGKHAN